jgi:hypothetical protein
MYISSISSFGGFVFCDSLQSVIMWIRNILAGFCFASTLLAIPSTRPRHEHRAASARRSLPRQSTAGVPGIHDGTDAGRYTDYGQYWAGATLVGSGYTSVTGTVVVPTPRIPPGGNSSAQYAAAAWVGIDGYTCGSALIQTGIAIWIQDGQPSYNAWYEWFPEASGNFDQFAVNVNDTIKMNVEASSKTSGTVTLDNLTTGQSVSHHFSGRQESLCQTNAEWVVEDFTGENSAALVPFVDFATVTFMGASAVANGSTVDTTGATIMDIKQSDRILTSCSAGGSEVVCSYMSGFRQEGIDS